MACFNVTWGLASDLGARGWPARSLDASASVEAVLAGNVDRLPVLVVVRDMAVHRWQAQVVHHAVDTGVDVAVVELGWPGDIIAGITTIASYGASRASAQAVIDVLANLSKGPI